MPEYRLNIHNSREAEVTIDVENSAEAMNAALNALTMFACRNFPPPDQVAIEVKDSESQPIGNVKLTFEMEMVEARLN